jgi:hypothetical protein
MDRDPSGHCGLDQDGRSNAGVVEVMATDPTRLIKATPPSQSLATAIAEAVTGAITGHLVATQAQKADWVTDNRLLTKDEIRSLLGGIGDDTLTNLRNQGLPVIHLGRFVRFDRQQVMDWVRARGTK